MSFSLIDAGGLTLAVLSYGLILILPGAALAHLCGAVGFRTAPAAHKPLLAIVVGLALLPAVDSIVTRFAGLGSALALTMALAAYAAVRSVKGGWFARPSWWSIALIAVWFAIVVFEWIDFDIGGKLYQPYIVFDMVKHAATAQAIHDTGAPPFDPFFLRPERVSYYYFFYTPAALSLRLCGGLIDARAAVGGLTFWTGVGLFGVIRLVLDQGGFLPGASARRATFLVAGLLAAGGLDIVAVSIKGLATGVWIADPASWNEQITGWFESVIWVPHHITALIALFTGFVAAAGCLTQRLKHAAGAIVVSGVCFASALGLSVWVTLAGVATAIVWVASLAVERRWRAVFLLALIGCVALIAAAPQIADLRTGRSAELPIDLTIRAFRPLDDLMAPGPWRLVARFVALPLNYFAGFGILALGSFLFWRDRRATVAPVNELARVLAIGAVSGLLLGTFLRSLLFNNDLGWRVMMLPMLAGLVWTATVIDRACFGPARQLMRRATAGGFALLAVVGYATSLYAGLGLRAYYDYLKVLPASVQTFAAHRETEYALREAYGWANENLPPQAVLQHNPNEPSVATRAIAFGLYSHHRVAVGDRFASLFGADFDQVSQRMGDLAPVYAQSLSGVDARNRLLENHVDDAVVTADDPVWNDKSSWVWRAPSVYATARVRIVPVAGIGVEQVGRLP